MADRAFPKTAFHGGEEISRVFAAGHEAEFVFGRGTQILPTLGAEIYGRTEVRMVNEPNAYWFEIGFTMDAQLSGNAAAGFTDAGNYFRIEVERSYDLVTWAVGAMVPPPTGAVTDNGNGTWTYWCRSTVPVWWYNVWVDLTLHCNRYGKSITAVSVGGSVVALSYPYAMPGEAARLQADIIAAGYAGAVVSNDPAALSVEIIQHEWSNNSYNRIPLPATLSGGSVTEVRTNSGTVIPLPGSPYAMPAQRAALQADLRAAGQSGAVVKLYADEWDVFLPDRAAADNEARGFQITFTPDDPHPQWDIFGTYEGEVPDDTAKGVFSNVRPGVGSATIPEADKQFARLKITSGNRYDPYQ